MKIKNIFLFFFIFLFFTICLMLFFHFTKTKEGFNTFTSSDYVNIGYYKDSFQRAIPKRLPDVNSVDNAIKEAGKKKALIFGIQYGGQLFYDNGDTSSMKSMNRSIKNGKATCTNPLGKGCAWMNNVFVHKNSMAYSIYLGEEKKNAQQIALAAAKVEADAKVKAEADANKKIVSNEPYTTNSTIKCGFYFKKIGFNSLYANVTIDKGIEDNIINNNYNYCFNIDENNNVLYSIVSNAPYIFTYTDIQITPNKNYQIKFNKIKANTDFLSCFIQFLNDCDNIGSTSYYFDFENNVIKCYMTNYISSVCSIYFKQINVDESSTIESNIKMDNIERIEYLDNKIDFDVSKKYTYGKLYYNTNYYNCIVMDV